MKYYRLIDEYWEPYYSGYNETDLKNLAECIYDLIQPDEFINPDWEYDLEKIYEWLLAWERDFIIFVEEADKPFKPDWEYWEDRENDLKYDLFDYLNNILFNTHTEVMDTARKRLNNRLWITIDENDLACYVSEFIDSKELYDLDYED